jgi:hypothetical protein
MTPPRQEMARSPDTAMADPSALYHFTCRDGHRMIGRYNCVLLPQSLWRVVWLTTEALPDFEATGLGSVTLKCDRTEYRYVVTGLEHCRPWLGSAERKALAPDHLRVLEQFGDPEHWRISAKPVRAIWDRSYVKATADA